MFSTRMLRTTMAVLALGLTGFAPGAAADSQEGAGSIKADMMFWIGDAESKLIELLDATPEEKFAWRPAEGVRSTGEVFMHVAGANYGIPSFWGVAPPEGFQFETWEKSLTKKEDIKAALGTSFAHMKNSLESADDAALTKPVEMFGMKTSVRGAYMLLLSHAHEHLGQSIAYARSNGIAPPWTARQNAQIEAAAAKAKEGAAKKDEHAGHKH